MLRGCNKLTNTLSKTVTVWEPVKKFNEWQKKLHHNPNKSAAVQEHGTTIIPNFVISIQPTRIPNAEASANLIQKEVFLKSGLRTLGVHLYERMTMSAENVQSYVPLKEKCACSMLLLNAAGRSLNFSEKWVTAWCPLGTILRWQAPNLFG